MIQALKDEIKSMGESLERYKEKGFSQYEIEGLIKLQTERKLLLNEFELGTGLHFVCDCGNTMPAYEFNFGISVQECEDCGNHVKVEVTCPQCAKTRTIYRDPQYR